MTVRQLFPPRRAVGIHQKSIVTPHHCRPTREDALSLAKQRLLMGIILGRPWQRSDRNQRCITVDVIAQENDSRHKRRNGHEMEPTNLRKGALEKKPVFGSDRRATLLTQLVFVPGVAFSDVAFGHITFFGVTTTFRSPVTAAEDNSVRYTEIEHPDRHINLTIDMLRKRVVLFEPGAKHHDCVVKLHKSQCIKMSLHFTS